MKMHHQQVSQIVIPPQVAPDLGDRQCGKGALGLQAYRSHIGEHLDQQSRVQTLTWSLHGTNMEHRFADLPEAFYQRVLLPHVPDFSTSHCGFAQVHQIKTAGGALLKK